MLFQFTLEGNVAAQPEVRYLESGVAVCEVRLMHTARYRRDGKWVDGSTIAISLTCWRDLAERAAELNKGDTVIADIGDDLHAEAYQGRAYLRATARALGVSLRFHGATSQRAARTEGHDSRDGWTGGYDTGASAGYVGTDQGQDGGSPDETGTVPDRDSGQDQDRQAPAARQADRPARASRPSRSRQQATATA